MMDEKLEVGDVLLMKTADGERPMLVIKVWSPTCVNGVLFVDGYNDRNLTIAGATLEEGTMMKWVTSISKGDQVGQWDFKGKK